MQAIMQIEMHDINRLLIILIQNFFSHYSYME